MSYYNELLKPQIEKLYKRLENSTYENFGFNLKIFLEFIDENAFLKSLINDIKEVYKFDYKELKLINDQLYKNDFTRDKRVAVTLELTNYFIGKASNHNLLMLNWFGNPKWEENKEFILDNYILPTFNYLVDRIDLVDYPIILLQKYKKRTEWYSKEELIVKYNLDKKESVFQKDLRLFLFDQGVDYPLSAPSSPSGEVDVLANIESDYPFIIEVKFLSKDKGYGKDKIKTGFNQIQKYTSDFHKNYGFLVIYNLDDIEVVFDFENDSKVLPPYIEINNVIYYFIVINMVNEISASQRKSIDRLSITKEWLIEK